jgi:hypothetical protein
MLQPLPKNSYSGPSAMPPLSYENDNDSPDKIEALDDFDVEYINIETSLVLLDEAGRKGFRVSPEKIAFLRETLALYKGTHDYHNYTKGVKGGEAR